MRDWIMKSVHGDRGIVRREPSAVDLPGLVVALEGVVALLVRGGWR